MSIIFGHLGLFLNCNIKSTAEIFSKDNLNFDEMNLLDLFRTLGKNKQQQAIGIIFASKNYKSNM